MRTFKSLNVILITMIITCGIVFSQNTGMNNSTKSIRKNFPYVTLSPFAGAIFPLPKVLNQNFKPGATVGLDVGYRVNREVGLYAKFGYYFMSSKISGAPIGTYLEFSAGPRYYLTHPKLKSSLFFEGGVGAYNFTQKSYANPQDTTGAVIAQINNTKAGINGGIGATLGVFDQLDLMVKGKYHVIFTPNGSSSFVTVGGGLEFRFK